MRSTLIRAAAVVPLVLIVGLQLTATRSSAATAANVGTSKEAWHESSVTGGDESDPTCQLPTGCAPAATPVRGGENTLQVGAAVGRDRARTFLSLDVRAIPLGGFITGGTLTLPVLTDEESGSIRPEAAKLAACAVSGPIKSVQRGGPADEPDFDCKTTAVLRYNAEAKPPTFTVDLKPFASTLSFGGVAIVPSKAARDAGETFQVAFPAKGHASKSKITASLTYDPPVDLSPTTPTGPQPPPTTGRPPPPPADTIFDPPPADSGGADTPSFSPGVGELTGASGDFAAPAAPAAPAAQTPVTAPQPQAAAPQAPVPAAAPVGATAFYAYPGIWLAPLALLGMAGLLARSLTGEIVLPEPEDATEASADAVPNLFRRLAAAIRPPAPAAG